MAQFIHLLLLLAATIQLPLVSVTRIQLREGTSVTFKVHQSCENEIYCRGQQCVSVNDGPLTINNLTLSDTGNYTCYHNSHHHILHLTVTRGCINDRLDGFDFSHQPPEDQEVQTEDDCKRLCTQSPTCEYFTFKKGGKKCFLIPSGSLVIERKNNFVSGYPDRGVCNGKNVTQIKLREGTSVSFKLPQECGSGDCCGDQQCEHDGSSISELPGVAVGNCQLNMIHLTHAHSGSYTCHRTAGEPILKLNLTVTRGCINDRLDGFDFSHQPPEERHGQTEDDCRRLCTESPTCEHFTFMKKSTRCFLILSGNLVTIQKNNNSVTGYPSSGVCNENDYAVGLQFHQQKKSWFEALKYCRDEHFSLVQITNSTMQSEVKSLLQNQSSSIQAGVWIGLERSMFGMSSIPWKWISGSEVGQPGQWNSSFPVDSLNNHCGKIIRVNETDFKWLDAWCHDELPFICQGSVSADPT